ncbi:MAG: hypothetical protein WC393_02105 [Candidatus Nanoarchaeia archaeon]|jgi:hypothetical protein
MDISNMLKSLKEKRENTEQLPDLEISKDEVLFANEGSTSKFYQEFWHNLNLIFNKIKHDIFLGDTAYPYSKINSSDELIKKLRTKGIHFEVYFPPSKSYITLGIHFENANRDSNILYTQKIRKNYENELQKLFDKKVRFEIWGKNWAKIDIFSSKNITNMNDLKNQELQEWTVNSLIKFYEFFIENEKIRKELEEMIK